ncbi:hypothetical protein [Neisseria meningitidis serogroup B]|uniref:Uncharacterized protein n=1 Tax=Neisseria meningitidis serogroup B TaxID=491 RepID=A0A0H5DLQ2_NEIMI|nr:hypothetical protein [Neisseria meningitidis serogroup B]
MACCDVAVLIIQAAGLNVDRITDNCSIVIVKRRTFCI